MPAFGRVELPRSAVLVGDLAPARFRQGCVLHENDEAELTAPPLATYRQVHRNTGSQLPHIGRRACPDITSYLRSAASPTPWRTRYLADRRCNDYKRDLLADPQVTAWARRSERRVALAVLATATQWDSGPQPTVAVVRRFDHAFARTRSHSDAWQMRARFST